MKRTIYLILIIAIVTAQSAFTQQVVLVKGHVSHEATNEPADVKFYFDDGGPRKIRVGSQNGFFKQALKSGNEYTVFVEDYLLIDPPGFWKVPKHDKYMEIDKNFVVKEIVKGMELASVNLYEPHDSTLIQSKLEVFDWLKDLMRFQRDLKIEVVVNSQDSYFKSKKVKEYYKKNGKVHYKWKTLSNKDQLALLNEARIKEIKDYLRRNRFRDNLVIYSSDIIETSRNNRKPDSPDLIIKVYEILNF